MNLPTLFSYIKMNLPQEIIRLILSPLSTRDVIVFSRVCKEKQFIVTDLPSLFWLSRVSIVEHTYFDDYNPALVQKVSHALEKHVRDCEYKSIFAVRDINIIPWLEENFKIRIGLIYEYDNEVLLANYVLFNTFTVLRDYSFLILKYNSARCFRWIRKHLTKNKSTNLTLKFFLSKLVSEKPESLCNFLKTVWDDIFNTASELSWIFELYSSSGIKNILIWLLEYPSLFDCNPWEQIVILLKCASNDELWFKLLEIHGDIPLVDSDYKNNLYPSNVYSWIYIVNKRRDIPVFQREYNKMLSTVSWEDWNNIYKPKKMFCHTKVIEDRLYCISRKYVRQLIY